MANIPLSSIKFPGLPDTYTVPALDNTLSTTGAAADAKKVGDELTSIKQDLNDMQTATAEDVGKALKAKTVEDGKVTEWEFGEAGGGDVSLVTAKMEQVTDGHNLCDPSQLAIGTVDKAGVERPNATAYKYTGKIPVSTGDVIRMYKVVDEAFSSTSMTFVTAYNSNNEAVEASGGTSAVSYTVPSGITGVVLTAVSADQFMVTANFVPTEFEEYASGYYIATDDFIKNALSDLTDNTLTDANKVANAKSTGDALAGKVSTAQGAENAGKVLVVGANGTVTVSDASGAGGSDNSADVKSTKLGNRKTVRREESSAVIQIDNSNIGSPIANAISAKIVSIAGTANGSIPTGFVSQSPNLLKPEIVCDGGYNKAVGYTFDLSAVSENSIRNNGDGTFAVFEPKAYKAGLFITDELIPAETYELHFALNITGGIATNLYVLDGSFTVTRKLEYLSASVVRNKRIKLDANEKYIALAVGISSAGKEVILLYPTVVMSKIKLDAVGYEDLGNESYKDRYVRYNTHKLTLNAQDIENTFTGFGQSDGTNANVLYVSDKKAIQYGYKNDGTWTADVRVIDLSDFITETDIELSPNGTLTLLYDGTDVPPVVIDYMLTTSMPYTGYSFCGLGDSLTAGPPAGSWGFYRANVKEWLGLKEYSDCGIGTSFLSGVNTYRPFWTDERVETLNIDADVVTIMGGTNDYGQYAAETTPISGKMTGIGTADISNHDCTTFIGAYNVLISKVMYKYMLSDGYYQDIDYTGLTRVSVAKPWFRLMLLTSPPRLENDNTRIAMEKIAEATRKVGAMWGLPVVDGHDNLGINEINKDSFFTVDYVHPNEQAHDRLAHLIVDKCRSLM